MFKYITKEYLQNHRNEIFVFGDNMLSIGHGGAAQLRDEPNTYGFITKRYPDGLDTSFFKPNEYEQIYKLQINQLLNEIKLKENKTFLISKLGAGLANKYKIFEKIIEPNIKNDLKNYKNIEFLW